MKAMRRRFPYWLLARRSVQLAVLAAFIYELPGLGRVVTGNLASSTWFGQLHLTDPFVALQALLAGQALGAAALIGALVVAVAYAALGGRIYCAWICPINLLTDLAHWLRTRLGVRRHVPVSRHVRYGVLAAAVCASAAGSTLAWEIVNPITLLQRELMFGVSSGSWLLVVLFLFDLLYSRRGWCGHLCPVGAFYALLGRFGRLQVSASGMGERSASVRACPEPQVLAPIVSGQAEAVRSGECMRCGACMDANPSAGLGMRVRIMARPRIPPA